MTEIEATLAPVGHRTHGGSRGAGHNGGTTSVPERETLVDTLLPGSRRPLHPRTVGPAPTGAAAPVVLDPVTPAVTDLQLTPDELSGRVLPGGPLTEQERLDLARLGAQPPVPEALRPGPTRPTDPTRPIGQPVRPVQPSELDQPGQEVFPFSRGEIVDPRVGLSVTHRRYVGHAHAHHAGDLVDASFSLSCFGDVATEVCIRTDGDEGLFAAYSDVTFHSPVKAGDVLEITATVVAVDRRTRELEFEARVICRGRPQLGVGSAEVVEPPLVVTTARGTVAVPGLSG